MPIAAVGAIAAGLAGAGVAATAAGGIGLLGALTIVGGLASAAGGGYALSQQLENNGRGGVSVVGGGQPAPSSIEDAYNNQVIANAQLQAQQLDAQTKAIESENKAILDTETAKSFAIGAGALVLGVVALKKLTDL